MPLTALVYFVTVAFTNLLTFNGDFSFGKARSRREPNLRCRGADRPGWCDVLPKNLYDSCGMDRRIDADSLICLLGDGHTVHKISQRRLTADRLDPRESDSSRMHSKVSSDWLPRYIKATRPVLEIIKMAGYFPDRPCIWRSTSISLLILYTGRQ